jgi:hypothetical protein
MRNRFVRYEKMTERAEIANPEDIPPIHICEVIYHIICLWITYIVVVVYYSDRKDVEGAGKWNVGGGIFDKDPGVVAAYESTEFDGFVPLQWDSQWQ